jgi:lipopolysaccharide export system protein LptA
MNRAAAPLAILCAVASLVMVAPAWAQGIGLPNQNRDAPIEIHADHGIEWRQDIQAYIARGNARAVQGDVSVLADTLTAYYRKAEPGAAPRGETSVGGASQGGSEIIRIDADGNVRIVSPRQTAYGAKAVYDVEKSILVLTGKPRMVTETDEITAQRSLEFWEQRSMAVARGDAIAVRGDKRLRADVLTAHFKDDAEGKAQMQRIDAFDNVLISSPTEIVRGRQGVYDVKTGIAVLKGSVKITRGEDQLNGDGAEVNLNTGVSKLLSDPDSRVTGSFRARRASPAPAETPEGGATDGKGKAPGE